MALSKTMQNAFNEQINAEMYSAYMYLSMATYLQSIDLNGFAAWMKVQYQEEMGHAMKMFDFVFERGGSVQLKAIDAPPTQWDGPLDVAQAVLAHEEKVTGLINNLAAVAEKENDRASMIFLQWFISEQVEEESTIDAIIKKFKLMKDAPGGMFMLDNELAQRVFTPPAESTTA